MIRITEVPPVIKFPATDFTPERYDQIFFETQYREGILRETNTLARWLIDKRKLLSVETVREFIEVLEAHIAKGGNTF
jgi:hypothetical protein